MAVNLKIMKRSFFLFLFFFCSISVQSQFMIRLKVAEPVDSIVYVRGVLFDDKNFIPKDTLHLKRGTAQFTSKTSIFGGIYYLYFPTIKQKVFFSLEKKDTMNISFTGKDPLGTIQSNNKENNIFFDYQRLEFSLSGVDSTFAREKATGKKFNLAQQEIFFRNKRDSLVAFRESVLKKMKQADVLALYFRTLNDLDGYLPQRSRPDLREAFIKKFDLNEPRLLFSNALEKIYYEYLSAFPMISDSLSKGIDTVMSKLICTNKAYTYSFDYFLRIIKNRSVVNSTEGVTALIEKYIKKGKCKYPDQIKAKEYLKLYEANDKLNDKSLSVNMLLKDTTGKEISLHEFARLYDYTVIMFYDPNCVHCQVEVPAMDSTIKVLEKKFNVHIGKYAVCNEPSMKVSDWKKFISDHQLSENYTHVVLGSGNNYRTDYDAYSNPTFFLINRGANFVSRKISPVSLRRLFPSLILTADK